MENLENKGCVYFFKHIGLEPIKIGFSASPSPSSRFDQFKTYAPFGAELVGFIICDNPKDLETLLHNKFASKRLKGEWFEITNEEAKKVIDFYQNQYIVEQQNSFQIEWAKKIDKDLSFINNKKINIKKQDIDDFKNLSNYEIFKTMYLKDKNIVKKDVALYLGVSKQAITKYMYKLKKEGFIK